MQAVVGVCACMTKGSCSGSSVDHDQQADSPSAPFADCQWMCRIADSRDAPCRVNGGFL